MNEDLSGFGYDYTNFTRNLGDDDKCVRCDHHRGTHDNRGCLFGRGFGDHDCKCKQFAKDNLDFVEQEAEGKGL